MNKALIIALLIMSFSKLALSQIKTFSESDDYLKLQHSDTVIIQSDSAYVLGYLRAEYLNRQLDRLDTIKELYSNVESFKTELNLQISELEKALNQLKNKSKSDSIEIRNSLQEVIIKLESISADLQDNNQRLKNNNIQLQERIEKLNSLIKSLNKELRWMWWNGMTDKILAFSGGILVGSLITLILII